MSNTLYQLYLKKVFNLASTMVVKMDAIAKVINFYVKAYGFPVNENDKTTWKYYMNLAGQYHPLDLMLLKQANNGASEKMLIKIAGNNGPADVDFTTQLLDPTTGDVSIANEYRYGGEYYQDLIRRYPNHEELILGILNPIPLSISINAKEGEILYCGGYLKTIQNSSVGLRTYYAKTQIEGREDTLLIEDNESNLIPELQRYVDSVLTRWHNPDYEKTDTFYIHSVIGMLFSHLPNRILNIRLDNCHTPMVHSYHVHEYLESHGYLGKYGDVLPLKQRLFLYRNLNYIEANTGKQSTLNLLVDNLLSPLNIPLAGYTLQHEMKLNPSTLTPTVVAVRNHINFKQSGSGDDIFDVDELLRREIPLARENSRDVLLIGKEIDEQVVNSTTNFLTTKVLESAMIDSTDKLPFPFVDVLMNLWLYSASTGNYTGTIFVTNPATADRLHLTPLNAFILMVYCINRGWTGTELVNIPVISSRLIPKQTLPDITLLRDVCQKDIIPDSLLTSLIGTTIPALSFSSADNFFVGAKIIHKELMRRYHVYAAVEDIAGRAQAELACSKLYDLEVACTLSTLSYEQWFHQNGIVLNNLNNFQYINLAYDIIKHATGNRENTNEYLNQLQKAVIAILRQFTSYSVQIIRSINDSPALLLDAKTMRYGNVHAYQRGRIRLPITRVGVMNVRTRGQVTTNTFVNPLWFVNATTV